MTHKPTAIFKPTNEVKQKNVLILGIAGMLGNTVFRVLSKNKNLNVYGSIRDEKSLLFFNNELQEKIIININVLDQNSIERAFEVVNPDVVINCVGVIKQLSESNEILKTVPINTLLPHQLAEICTRRKGRLIQISTDCVFSGSKGSYVESDFPDCYDIYGRTKLLGEIDNSEFVVTLRTSIIGHELNTNKSLVDWFLSQNNTVNGFTKAIYSGLPTVELANVIDKYVVPNSKLQGLYHVAGNSINKYDLLNLISKIYNKKILIEQSEKLVIDRSLVADKFNNETGYIPPDWQTLIELMNDDYMNVSFKKFK